MEKILEGNRLIIESPFASEHHANWRDKAKEAGDEFYTERLLPELNYHESWDWLIPVIEKICSQRYSSPSGGATDVSVSITHKHTNFSKNAWAAGEDFMIVNRCSGKTMIENTWLAVVEFIKWANKRNQSLNNKNNINNQNER